MAVAEPVEDYAGTEEAAETPEERRARKGAELQEAKRTATERYAVIAELIKREACVRKHFEHKSISGLAFSGQAKILAPEGITRRQLYVLAHECGHILLHSSATTICKASHVKELEAEIYAHRAFARYGLEVPEKSARWARADVGPWIMKDRAAGVAISHEAVAWAAGKREPSDPLPAVDGQPHNDFSKSIDRFISKSVKTVEKQEAEIAREPKVMHMEPVIYGPPNACGTCTYFVNMSNYDYHKCSAHGMLAKFARPHASFCNNGQSWRPEAGEINKIKAIYAVAERVFLHALETQLSIACPGEKFGRSTILKSLLLPSRAKS